MQQISGMLDTARLQGAHFRVSRRDSKFAASQIQLDLPSPIPRLWTMRDYKEARFSLLLLLHQPGSTPSLFAFLCGTDSYILLPFNVLKYVL